MADIADVMDALQRVCVSAIYPGGSPSPGASAASAAALSVSGKVVNVGQNWPPAGAVDDAMGRGWSLVSISPVNGTTSKQPVPISGGDGVIKAAVHGLTAALAPGSFALTGIPGAGEYVAAVVGRNAFTYSAVAGDTAQDVMGALAALIPGAFVSSGSVIVPSGPDIQIRIGAPGLLGQIIDRQTQNFQVITWSPTSFDRNAVGIPIDQAIKQNLTVEMPDSSISIWQAQVTNFIDKYQDEKAFRRDLIVRCQWDTLETYTGYEIVVVSATINSGPSMNTINF